MKQNRQFRPLANGSIHAASAALAIGALSSGMAQAEVGDARAIALGGSAIAAGHGAAGIYDNPATLLRLQRAGERAQLHIGFAGELRVDEDAIDSITDEDNEDLADDADDEIDTLSNTVVTCNPLTDPDDTACVTGTAGLASVSDRLLELLDDIDDEDLEGQLTGTLGLGVTSTEVPFAVHLTGRATGFGRADVTDNDRAYFEEFSTLLGDDGDGGVLTLGEIEGTDLIDLPDTIGGTLDVEQPEDVVTSQGEARALLRGQIAVSFAHALTIGGHTVDVGVTPKFSTLTAGSLDADVADTFDDDADSLRDQFEDSEVDESSFTFDLGASLELVDQPIRLAAVARNVLTESIETNDGFEFETTPQLIVGAAWWDGPLTVTADLALNSAKLDNFETQPLALGIEYRHRWLALRGGVSHDGERDDDATALSAGIGLGPLEIGTRLAGPESGEFAAQLAFTF